MLSGRNGGVAGIIWLSRNPANGSLAGFRKGFRAGGRIGSNQSRGRIGNAERVGRRSTGHRRVVVGSQRIARRAGWRHRWIKSAVAGKRRGGCRGCLGRWLTALRSGDSDKSQADDSPKSSDADENSFHASDHQKRGVGYLMSRG